MSDHLRRAPWPVEDPLRVGILLFEGFEPLDAIGPAQVFWSLMTARDLLEPFAPIEVHLVAETTDPVRAGHGLVVHPTVTYAAVGPLDVLIVPGGSGHGDDVIPDSAPASGRRFQAGHRPTIEFVANQSEHAAIVASVCTGSFILGAAGLLVDRPGNTHWSARDELAAFMVERSEPFTLVPDRVVDDGDVITGGGVSSGIDVALTIIDRLLGPACRSAAAAIVELETPAAAARSGT